MDEASAHPRASPRLCHRNAPTWAANLSLPPGHCAHPRPGHTPRPWSAERVVRPLPTSPVSFHTLHHIRFSSVPQMHHEPLAPRGLCTCKPLWFGFPRPLRTPNSPSFLPPGQAPAPFLQGALPGPRDWVPPCTALRVSLQASLPANAHVFATHAWSPCTGR